MSKRGKLEIIYTILTIIQENDNSIKHTPLLRYTNISSQSFSEYYNELIDGGETDLHTHSLPPNYRIDSGSLVISGESLGTANFNFTFTSPPIVVMSRSDFPTGEGYASRIRNISTTYCEIFNGSRSTSKHYWIAVGPTN